VNDQSSCGPANAAHCEEDAGALIAIVELIKADIEAGRADETTIQMWNSIRDTMTAAFDALRQRLVGVPAADQERVKQQWYEDFLAEHWPSSNASPDAGVAE
jgi:hypothetical protein